MTTDTIASIGHNRTPTAEAEDLLETFERAPENLDSSTVEAAITLAKQMKLAADELEGTRKFAVAPLREEIAELERPFKDVAARLSAARALMIVRIAAHLDRVGKEQLRTSLGLIVYRKRSVDFEIEDARKLPRGYRRLVPDTERIQAAIARGETVPGVRRIEKIQTIVV